METKPTGMAINTKSENNKCEHIYEEGALLQPLQKTAQKFWVHKDRAQTQ